MFEVDPRLLPRDADVLRMYASYLDSVGVKDDFWVGPFGGKSVDARLTVQYEPASRGNDWLKARDYLNASVKLVTQMDTLELSCRLRDALHIALPLTTAVMRRQVSGIRHDDDPATTFGTLHVDASKVAKPAVKSWLEGSFVSPEANGFASYYVDTHGELTILARAATAPPVIVFHAAQQVFEEQRLGDKVAPFRPKS